MRNILFLLAFACIFSACNQEVKDYAKVTFDLKDKRDTEITLMGSGINKKIQINAEGVFTDTLHLKESAYLTFYTTDPRQRGFVFLNNGYDLEIQSDAANFIQNTSFKGEGEDTNNLILSEIQYRGKVGDLRALFDLEEDEFKKKVAEMDATYDSIHNAFTNVDSVVLNSAISNKGKLIQYLHSNYNTLRKISKGQPSPVFNNYESYKGKPMSLSDFKGKYVYIDLWASWCKPCIAQIPYLKSLKKEYKGKNLEIVSISTDSDRRSGTWEKAEEAWRNMVKDKDLGGVQLWAGQDLQFSIDYQVSGIPRFILLDPEGKIVDSNAPRPMEPRLKELFNELGI